MTEMAMNRQWPEVPSERIAEGVDRQMVVGERLMMCRLTIQAHVDTPVHSHPHEQMTIVERGRVRFTIDGASRLCRRATCTFHRTAHGATMLDEEVV